MQAYRKSIVIVDPASVELTNLPFRKGQRIEVVMIAEEDDIDGRLNELRALFKQTQSLSHIQAVSDDMIAEEVARYRSGK